LTECCPVDAGTTVAVIAHQTSTLKTVVAGLDPAIQGHGMKAAFLHASWIAGSSPA
jgi:hypothetical protein